MRLRSLAAPVTMLLLGSLAHAAQMYRTGEGIRHKKLGFIHAKVYEVVSEVSRLPAERTPQGVINLDADKVLTWRMLRSVDSRKCEDALREAYARNGYHDPRKIETALSAFRTELPKGAIVTIRYDAATKTTSVTTSMGGRASVPGVEFMRATWSIWFGNIDEPALTNELMSRLR
jgi:Chalcone isomerase-like